MGIDHSSNFYQVQTATGWRRTLTSFAAWCDPKPGWLTLDVGCGPGYLPVLMASYDCKAFGVDIDFDSFQPARLHKDLVVGDAQKLPFPANSFNLVTASNLLFMLENPLPALIEFTRVLVPGGLVVMLNPSEFLNKRSAELLADQHSLSGLDRLSLMNWAERAEKSWRFKEDDLKELHSRAGLVFLESILKVGNGLARFTRGQLPDLKN
jgi:ubiquinone/menaquinone biosynthesis C-methylase UbiE